MTALLQLEKKIRVSFDKIVTKKTKGEVLTVKKLYLPDLVRQCLEGRLDKASLCEFRAPIPDVAAIEVEYSFDSRAFAQAEVSEVSSKVPSAGATIAMMGYGDELPVNQNKSLRVAEKKVVSHEKLLKGLKGTNAEKDNTYPAEKYFFGVLSNPEREDHANLGFGDSGGPVYSSGKIVGVNSDGYCFVDDGYQCRVNNNSVFAKIPYKEVSSWIEKSIED